MMPTMAPPTAPPMLPLPAVAGSVATDGSAMLKGAFASSCWLAGAEMVKVEVGSPEAWDSAAATAWSAGAMADGEESVTVMFLTVYLRRGRAACARLIGRGVGGPQPPPTRSHAP